MAKEHNFLHLIFGIRLKNLREQKKIRQADLAEQLGVSQITVSNWESGRQEPSLVKIRHLADILKVDANYLFCLDAKTMNKLERASEKTEECEIPLEIIKKIVINTKYKPDGKWLQVKSYLEDIDDDE